MFHLRKKNLRKFLKYNILNFDHVLNLSHRVFTWLGKYVIFLKILFSTNLVKYKMDKFLVLKTQPFVTFSLLFIIIILIP